MAEDKFVPDDGFVADGFVADKHTPGPAGGYGTLNSIGKSVKDFTAGIGSGAISTGVSAYNLARKIPGVGDVLPAPNEYVRGLTQPPQSLPGKAGHLVEQGAEYMVPGGAAKGAGLLRRAVVAALESAGVAGLQSEGNPVSMATAGTLGGAATAIPAAYGVAKRVASNPEARDALIEMLPKGKQGLKVRDILSGTPPVPKPAPRGEVLGRDAARRVIRGQEAAPGKPFDPWSSQSLRNPEVGDANVLPPEVASPPFSPQGPMPDMGGLAAERARRIIANQERVAPGTRPPFRSTGVADATDIPLDAANPPPAQPTLPPRAVGPPPAGDISRVQGLARRPEQAPPPTRTVGPPPAADISRAQALARRPAEGSVKPNPVPPIVPRAKPIEIPAMEGTGSPVEAPPNMDPATELAESLTGQKPQGGRPVTIESNPSNRRPYEFHNLNLKLGEVEAQLKARGITDYREIEAIPEADLAQMFRDQNQHRAGFYSKDPVGTRKALELRFGAPINLRNPNIPAKAKGGVVAPRKENVK